MPTPVTQWIRTAAVLIAFYQFVEFLTGAIPLVWGMLTAPSHTITPGPEEYVAHLVFIVVLKGIWLLAARWLYTRSERIAGMIETPKPSPS